MKNTHVQIVSVRSSIALPYLRKFVWFRSDTIRPCFYSLSRSPRSVRGKSHGWPSFIDFIQYNFVCSDVAATA